jgi:tRNA(fMet)-specific endonuclease VapC
VGALIDTSVLIAVQRGGLALEDLLKTSPDERWFISTVTASEMLHGVLGNVSPVQGAARLAFAEDKIQRFPVLDFDLAAARMHAEICAELARRARSSR